MSESEAIDIPDIFSVRVFVNDKKVREDRIRGKTPEQMGEEHAQLALEHAENGDLLRLEFWMDGETEPFGIVFGTDLVAVPVDLVESWERMGLKVPPWRSE